MNGRLRNLMAQMESWEAANEFGIPEKNWANYDVRERSDDLYVACLSEVFDALRMDEGKERAKILDSLAKILVIYSRSAAARHLEGIERHLNQLYAAALFYLAGRPASATFLVRLLPTELDESNEEEAFLHDFLARNLGRKSELNDLVRGFIEDADTKLLTDVTKVLTGRVRDGLASDSRQFIAATLALHAVKRFSTTNVWTNLRQFAPDFSVKTWRPFFLNGKSFAMWELLPSQIKGLKAGLLDDLDTTVSLQMPTSAGKTSLCEVLLFNEVKVRKKKVLFLVPFRALAAEIRSGMSARLEASGIEIMASHGGNIPTRSETSSIEEVDVLIVTPEKFAALDQVIENFADQFATIICDEGHLIDDESRGLSYELLLTRLTADEKHKRKVVFISAILPNIAQIHKWLGGQETGLATSKYRPVATDYAFLTPHGKNGWMLDVNPIYDQPLHYALYGFLGDDDFRYLNPETKKLNLISGRSSFIALTAASALRARVSGPVAVFTTTRGDKGIAGIGEKIHELCTLGAAIAQNAPALPEELSSVTGYCRFLLGAGHLLPRLLEFGVGFHHGKMPQELRRVMEECIEAKTINILLCTSTLAEGVNLPIRTLVVHTVRRYNIENAALEFIKRRSIKNMIGRVGRAGKETRGRVVFVTNTERHYIREVLKEENMEPAHGRLFGLVQILDAHLKRHQITLKNELLEQQKPWFLALIDSIDQAIIDLIPEETPVDEVAEQINELLDRTLASHQDSSKEFKKHLSALFKLRGGRLKELVPSASWGLLKRTGSSPRFWKQAEKVGVLASKLWTTLVDAADSEWTKEIVIPLLEFPNTGELIEPKVTVKVINGWMAGRTYAELAVVCGKPVDEVLEIICGEIDFRLQELVSKACQLAIAKHGEDNVSEMAEAWPSLLRYGLGTLQQLDLFERGATDRLAVWGIQRELDRQEIDLRGKALMKHIRDNQSDFYEALQSDDRVPALSFDRTCGELGLSP